MKTPFKLPLSAVNENIFNANGDQILNCFDTKTAQSLVLAANFHDELVEFTESVERGCDNSVNSTVIEKNVMLAAFSVMSKNFLRKLKKARTP
jgi:hypothetical protein